MNILKDEINSNIDVESIVRSSFIDQCSWQCPGQLQGTHCWVMLSNPRGPQLRCHVTLSLNTITSVHCVHQDPEQSLISVSRPSGEKEERVSEVKCWGSSGHSAGGGGGRV